jgi:hypothetical protein
VIVGGLTTGRALPDLLLQVVGLGRALFPAFDRSRKLKLLPIGSLWLHLRRAPRGTAVAVLFDIQALTATIAPETGPNGVQILRSRVELTYGEQLDAVLLTVGP